MKMKNLFFAFIVLNPFFLFLETANTFDRKALSKEDAATQIFRKYHQFITHSDFDKKESYKCETQSGDTVFFSLLFSYGNNVYVRGADFPYQRRDDSFIQALLVSKTQPIFVEQGRCTVSFGDDELFVINQCNGLVRSAEDSLDIHHIHNGTSKTLHLRFSNNIEVYIRDPKKSCQLVSI